MPSLCHYHEFLRDMDESCGSLEGVVVEKCPSGCSDCCGPQTVHPVEAYAILKGVGPLRSWRKDGERPVARCAFLTAVRTCRIYPVRPFVCRARGVPALTRAVGGELIRDCCQKKRFLAGSTGIAAANALGLRLDQWKARLNRLNEAFCQSNAIPNRPIRLSDLFRAPWVYFALFEYVKPSSRDPGLSMA
jgi:hypothetical protein